MPPPVPGTKARVRSWQSWVPAVLNGILDLLSPLGRPPAKSRAQPCAPTIRIEANRAQGFRALRGWCRTRVLSCFARVRVGPDVEQGPLNRTTRRLGRAARDLRAASGPARAFALVVRPRPRVT